MTIYNISLAWLTGKPSREFLHLPENHQERQIIENNNAPIKLAFHSRYFLYAFATLYTHLRPLQALHYTVNNHA